MGSSDQVGNELDEFVTETLRNNLLGPAARPADASTCTGLVTPASRRSTRFAGRSSPHQRRHSWRPYTSWSDFGQHLKHPESLINFVAAYGTHPTHRAGPTACGKR